MEMIYQISEIGLLFCIAPLLLAAAELGFQIGFPGRNLYESQVSTLVGVIQGGVLGLLGLLLGFLFSMSVSRYETRRTLVVDEANAIGTVALRSDFLPVTQRPNFRTALLDYTLLRIKMGTAHRNRDENQKVMEQVSQAKTILWQTGATFSLDQPNAQPPSLLIKSLNDLFDSQGRTNSAYLNHVPETGLLMVFLVALVAMGMIGYGSGLSGSRMWRSTCIFAFLVTMVLLLIMDMDRPQRGLIQVSMEPLNEVARSLQTTP